MKLKALLVVSVLMCITIATATENTVASNKTHTEQVLLELLQDTKKDNERTINDLKKVAIGQGVMLEKHEVTFKDLKNNINSKLIIAIAALDNSLKAANSLTEELLHKYKRHNMVYACTITGILAAATATYLTKSILDQAGPLGRMFNTVERFFTKTTPKSLSTA